MKEARVLSTPSDAMWAHLLEFEFVAGLGDDLFRACEARLQASQYGLIRFTFDQLRVQHRLRSMTFADFVEVVGDLAESFALCRLYYKENGLGATDPLPEDVAPLDRQQLDSELVFSGMLNAVFVLAARGAVTEQVLAILSAILTPWLQFVSELFIRNTIDAEKAVRDQSLAWPWQAVASVRVAIDSATRPAAQSKLRFRLYMFEGLGDEGPPLLRVFRPGLEVVEFPRRCLTQAAERPES